MRANTQAMINTNLETEKNIKGSVLPILDRLHKEVKNKAKELAHGAQRGAKEVDKARAITQKHIEVLGQQTAAFEATGGKLDSNQDPYVINRGVLYRLNRQVIEENNHRNDLIAVQGNFETFEAHVIQVIQQAMEAFNMFAGGQADRIRALYGDMLSAAQRIPPDMEWKSFSERFSDILVDPNEPPRVIESITYPNQDHPSTNAVIEGSLERKSRNKLSFGFQTGYYVVSPSRFLHEFKDSDNIRKEPTPELSIYLPDAVIGSPVGDKFSVKGKDRSKSMGSRLAGSSELHFKAHSPADAEKWYYIIRDVAGSAHASHPESSLPTSPIVASPTSPKLTSPTTPSPPPAVAAAAAADTKTPIEAPVAATETGAAAAKAEEAAAASSAPVPVEAPATPAVASAKAIEAGAAAPAPEASAPAPAAATKTAA